MKKVLLGLALLTLVSCKNKTEDKKLDIDLTPKEVIHIDEEDEVTELDKVSYPKEQKEVIHFLTPRYYDKDAFADFIGSMNDSWLQLDDMNGLVKVNKARFVLSDVVNECTGTDQIGVFSPDEVEPMFFMAPNQYISEGTKETLHFSDAPLWPNKPQDFEFNGQKYTLRSEGKEIASYDYTDDDGKLKKYKAFSKYKLYISVGHEEQLMLEIEGFNDTFIKLLFVGDLDGDGKLDFIFDTSADYEVSSTEIYLSKGASHFLYLAGINAADFSC